MNRSIEAKKLKMKRRGKHSTYSRATVNTGMGPNPERMAEYYLRVHSYDQALPATLGLSEPRKEIISRWEAIVHGIPKEMRISLVNNPTGMLDLFYSHQQFFFVDVDYKNKTIRRSRVYGSKDYAMKMLKYHSIVWVEVSSPRKSDCAAHSPPETVA